jgi:hypothetical protein
MIAFGEDDSLREWDDWSATQTADKRVRRLVDQKLSGIEQLWVRGSSFFGKFPGSSYYLI